MNRGQLIKVWISFGGLVVLIDCESPACIPCQQKGIKCPGSDGFTACKLCKTKHIKCYWNPIVESYEKATRLTMSGVMAMNDEIDRLIKATKEINEIRAEWLALVDAIGEVVPKLMY